MTKQEEYNMEFSIISHEHGNSYFCTHRGESIEFALLADLYSSEAPGNLRYVYISIQNALNNEPHIDDYIFESLDEELIITGTSVDFGGYNFDIMDFHVLLGEWLSFCGE